MVFTNGNYLVGEIKDLDKGVLTMETDFSDSDFKIELDGIKGIYTATTFLITLKDGERLKGTIETLPGGKIRVEQADTSRVLKDIDEIVYMKSIDKGVLDRLYASVDFGLDLTKANNFTQMSTRSRLGYMADKWSGDAYFNLLRSKQDSVENIKRTEYGIGGKIILPRDWYIPGSLDFLSNTEQKLSLRTTVKVGAGNFLIHTNKTYWTLAGGLNYNNEDYFVDIDDRKSLEGFLGTELNLFDIGDLKLLTNLFLYPGITETGRWRADFNFDIKYDLPLDFYITMAFTVNYDNMPVPGASDFDYIFHTGFGWEW